MEQQAETPQPGIVHMVRNSLLVNERTFVLAEGMISWSDNRANGALPLPDISSVELITYPGPDGRIGQCTLRDKAGRKLKFRSHSYRSLGNFEPRIESYSKFIRELCVALAGTNPDARFQAGHSAMWYAYIVILVLAVLTCIFFLVAGIVMEKLFGALPMLLGLAVLIPFLLRQVRRNKKVAFDPANVPAELIV